MHFLLGEVLVSKAREISSNLVVHADYSQVAQLAERRTVNSVVGGSCPPLGVVTEPKVVEGLVCETSNREFKSLQSPFQTGCLTG